MASKMNQSNDIESTNAMNETSQNSLSHNAEQGSVRSLNESISHLNLDDLSASTLNLNPIEEDVVSDDETQNQGSIEPTEVDADPSGKVAVTSRAMDDGCSGSASSATMRPIIPETGRLSTQPESPVGMGVHDQVRARANRPLPSPIGHSRRTGTRQHVTLFDSLASMNLGAGVPPGRGQAPAAGGLDSLFERLGGEPRPTNLGAQSTRASERPRLSPRNAQGQGSGGPPVPTLFGYITDTLQQAQAGPSNVGPRHRAPGPSNSQSGRQHGRLAVPPPHILEMMAAEINSSHQTSEHGDSDEMMNFHREAQANLMDLLNTNPSPHPLAMFPHLIPRHEAADVDQMSYEELLALGDEIGRVRTGLSEETIMTHLRQRNYECGTSEPSASPETCPICREVYAAGESIGTLDCNHEFHTHCIRTWLAIKNECPICKMKGLDA
ncbi:uncharacterized protein LOC141631737 isoform X2 [Silene latifolia]|uniref:uncharacterized protein LOC141631737 isoform X2 n=1 Tax=Silene latifolia TaxID=37657 RepID=UPI003D7771FC